jgi:hypothetical protein
MRLVVFRVVQAPALAVGRIKEREREKVKAVSNLSVLVVRYCWFHPVPDHEAKIGIRQVQRAYKGRSNNTYLIPI